MEAGKNLLRIETTKQALRRWLGPVAAAVVSIALAGCTNGSQDEEGRSVEPRQALEEGEHSTVEGEHAGIDGEGERAEAGEGHGELGEAGRDEGEESGVYIGRGETWDAVRGGARLVLRFDPASNAFVGTVENTTERTLCDVRVEVHLSSRTELGPTPRTDVPPGERADVTLAAEGDDFDTWTAHAEISPCGGG